MTTDLDRRAYDLLRLIDANEPIGSIRLVDLMQRRGYSIKGRTIRLTLSELDGAGLTRKVPGRGRRLTDRGREELARGDVSGRLERVRERIATLTSRVTYDPTTDAGEVVAGAATVARADLDAALAALAALHESGVGPIVAAAEAAPSVGGTVDPGGDGADSGRATGGASAAVRDAERVRLLVPSSITLDGVLTARGVHVDLRTAGLVEYRARAEAPVRRYVDAISGEGSTVDVVGLLFEAGRTDVEGVLDGEGVLGVDSRRFPLARFEEARDLASETVSNVGGVVDLRRPRESGPFPHGGPGWEFASLTCAGASEAALALLCERDLLAGWETLHGVVPRAAFDAAPAVRAALRDPS